MIIRPFFDWREFGLGLIFTKFARFWMIEFVVGPLSLQVELGPGVRRL